MPQLTFNISTNAIKLAARGLDKQPDQTDGQVLKTFIEDIIKARIMDAKREDAITAANTNVSAAELS